jgi:RNA polymerase sigma-70 factor, ECF subfamily
MIQSDEFLLNEAQAGSRAAWGELFERHQGRIYRFALQMSGSPAAADEVVQETFLAFLRGGLRFDAGRGSLSSYLLGVARLKLLRLLSRSLRNGSSEADLDGLAAPADLALDVESRQRHAVLHGAILELPEQFREAVALCELSELSYEEAAAVIGCPVGTIRSRLHRARQMLLGRLVEKGIYGVH